MRSGNILDNVYIDISPFTSIPHKTVFDAMHTISPLGPVKSSQLCRSFYLNFHRENESQFNSLQINTEDKDWQSSKSLLTNEKVTNLLWQVLGNKEVQGVKVNWRKCTIKNIDQPELKYIYMWNQKEVINLRKFPLFLLKIIKEGLTTEKISRFMANLDKAQDDFIKEQNLSSGPGQQNHLVQTNKELLKWLEYCLSGELLIEQIPRLTAYQAKALGSPGDGFMKYFGINVKGGIETMITKELDFDFNLLNNQWLQRKLDKGAITFEQLNKYKKNLGETSYKGNRLTTDWFQQRFDRKDLTLDAILRLGEVFDSSVQWCLDNFDNSKDLMQDVLTCAEDGMKSEPMKRIFSNARQLNLAKGSLIANGSLKGLTPPVLSTRQEEMASWITSVTGSEHCIIS